MKYILVLIALMGDTPISDKEGVYDTMNECFDAREIMVEKIGRPIIGWQAICILKPQET